MGHQSTKLKGDEGDDVLVLESAGKADGKKGDDAITGSAGDDKLKGGKGDDLIAANGGDDKIKGGKGDDELAGGAGDDRIDGGKGFDAAVFEGSIFDFSVEIGKGGKVVVTDLNAADGDEGRDELKKIETLVFSDGEIRVDGANSAPVALVEAGATDEDTAFEFAVDAFDFDGGTPVVTEVTVVGGGTVTATGSTATTRGAQDGVSLEFIFDPNGDFDDLGAGESRDVEILLTVEDGQGGVTEVVQDITVDGIDDAPIGGGGGGGIDIGIPF